MEDKDSVVARPTKLFVKLEYCLLPHPLTLQPVSMVEDNGLVIVQCKRHLVTRLLIGDVLLLVAYLWGLYIFHIKSPEHLATLMETVSFVLTSRSQQSLLLLLTCHWICKNLPLSDVSSL